MKVAIMSDSHDSIPNLKKAIEICLKEEVEKIFHCGDLISPFMVPILGEFNKEIHLILGNNPGDVYLLIQKVSEYPNIKFHGDNAFLEIEEYKIAMVHYPKIAYALAKTGDYHFIFCGHTHKYEIKEFNKALVINPGEILGKEGVPSFVILDLKTKQYEKITF
ncbi:MAG: metallophosphoesterase [Thermodesulfobacterium geofontis]|uniref:Phosphoesterase n=1 Tax=Thermodesulfobacterium geofontis TaxID=1295609 RepID=A0A2N7PNQ3_9BACT|nr:MAG: metallophosphoesterase [Thermodesulfobacterium geofontis]